MSEASRAAIENALTKLATGSLRENATALFAALGYASPKTLETDGDAAVLLEALQIPRERLPQLAQWRTLDLLFQLTGDELPDLNRGNVPTTGGRYQRGAIDSFVFLALDLDGAEWKRADLVDIVRQLNRGFAMPAILLFRYGGKATLAVIDRRASKRDPNRDVIGGKISLIKDIDLARPHRAHVEILSDLALSALRPTPADFDGLYSAWLDRLSASAINKRFYDELANWFAWASGVKADGKPVVVFPPGQGNTEAERQVGLIRLLTRLMFVWFIKQKHLVPAELFERDALENLLTESPAATPDGSTYYTAILQNLFFACLNTEWDNRDWIARTSAGETNQYLIHNSLRYKTRFAQPDKALELFRKVPFLNGGLFDCLDVPVDSDDDKRWERATRETRAGRVLRVDGFSETEANQPHLPNRLFFGGEQNVDLSSFYGRRRTENVPGLIDLFERYKFTIEENTPLAEEAALDPELLGKVFENLLAAYNEDTRSTARSKSGSFYTPREVVEFMVDEALVAYLAPVLAKPVEPGLRPRAPGLDFGAGAGELSLSATSRTTSVPVFEPDEPRLRALLDPAADAPVFSDAEANLLINAIEQCRAIDPAVGSGAFPMGLLARLVHVLGRLDPGGVKWLAANRRPLERALSDAQGIKSPVDKAEGLKNAQDRLDAFDASFSQGNTRDYARKLYLIEGCLYGVDIQPIAVQIAKLRCFIALAVEQKVDEDAPNRGVTPLPNLEMKFVAANALGLVGGAAQGVLRDDRIGALETELRDTAASFFTARNRKAKKAAQDRIKELRGALGNLLAKSVTFTSEDAIMVATWDPFDANSAAPFFDPAWMFGLEAKGDAGCFDIVLANPPYVRAEKIEDYKIDGKTANSKTKLRAGYETHSGAADLYVYFYERSVRLLKTGGVLAFITSHSWYRAGFGAGLRRWLSAQTRLRAVIDFGDAAVFDAIAYPTIVIATRRATPVQVEGESFRALTLVRGEASDGFTQRFAADAFRMPQAALLSTGWQFEPQGKRDLLARLRAAGKPLGEWCGGRLYRGILTGLNEAFVIDDARRAELVAADPASAEIIKPFLRGRDVKRWQIQPAGKWVIFTRQGVAIDRYPAIMAHLEAYRTALEPKPSNWNDAKQGPWPGRKAGRYKWFEIQDTVAYHDAFSGPKIIVPAIEQRVAYAPDNAGFYSNDKTSIIVTSRWRVLLAVLNSSISWWLTKQEFASKQGGFYEFKPMYVSKLPIPNPTPDQEALIAIVVDAILAGAQPRSRLEALLDAFVYELFFAADLGAKNLSPFATARAAGLGNLSTRSSSDLARAAEDWSRQIADPASALYATLFELQTIDAIRIIEGD